MMQPNLVPPFLRETTELEADIEHMYCDSLGLVTVAVGRMIEGSGGIISEALRYPFRKYKDHTWASESEIRDEFARIKEKGGDYRAAKLVAELYLASDDRADVFTRTLDSIESSLRTFLPKWDKMPSEAQWAVLSMAWNLGANFLNPKATKAYWPNLHYQLKSEDYFGAAGNCLINGRSSARNRYNRAHFLNALVVKVDGQELATLIGNQVKVSASKVAAAAKSPSVRSSDAIAVQAFLKDTGHYKSSLDGLFGNISQTAWKAYCKTAGITSTNYTAASITKLAKAAVVDAMVS